MSDPLYIDDGFLFTKSFDIGRHHYTVEYRPKLYEERLAFHRRANSGPEAQLKAHHDLIREQVLTVNGQPIDKSRVAQLRPELAAKLIDLILGYEPEDEARDVKNLQ